MSATTRPPTDGGTAHEQPVDECSGLPGCQSVGKGRGDQGRGGRPHARPTPQGVRRHRSGRVRVARGEEHFEAPLTQARRPGAGVTSRATVFDLQPGVQEQSDALLRQTQPEVTVLAVCVGLVETPDGIQVSRVTDVCGPAQPAHWVVGRTRAARARDVAGRRRRGRTGSPAGGRAWRP